jgi:hypothetical protein
MTIKKVLQSPWCWFAAAVCGLLTWMVYNTKIPPKYYPVEGMVLLDGEPFVPELLLDGRRDLNLRADFVPPTEYTVRFTPTSAVWYGDRVYCGAKLDRKGRYRLTTEVYFYEGGSWLNPGTQRRETHTGAALGWYEVTITNLLDSVSEPQRGDAMADHLRKKLGLKHRTTPYRIKIVEHPEPGHYDIKLETYLGTGKAQEGVQK